MKKFFLPLFSLFVLCGCGGSSSSYDLFLYYHQVYDQLTIYNDIAIDPFNVAFRLNYYLKLKRQDPAEAEAALANLFTTATLEQTAPGIYDITYVQEDRLPVYDFIKSGTIRVVTHDKLLDESGTVWQVSTPDIGGSPYLIYTNLVGTQMLVVQESDGYTVEALGEYSWKVTADDPVTVNYYGSAVNAFWKIDVTVNQVGGAISGKLEDLRFEVQTNDIETNGGKYSYIGNLRYETLQPLLYKTECEFMQKAGGEEWFEFMEYDYGFYPLDTLVFNRGADFQCNVGYSITGRDEEGKRITKYY